MLFNATPSALFQNAAAADRLSLPMTHGFPR